MAFPKPCERCGKRFMPDGTRATKLCADCYKQSIIDRVKKNNDKIKMEVK